MGHVVAGLRVYDGWSRLCIDAGPSDRWCVGAGAIFALLPRWLCLLGIAIGLAGQLSVLSLLFPWAVYFVPLTRFPGFAWLILCGFKLPRSVQTQAL
jgi:hypothetical protein